MDPFKNDTPRGVLTIMVTVTEAFLLTTSVGRSVSWVKKVSHTLPVVTKFQYHAHAFFWSNTQI